jgi:hypothetical protein
MTIVCEPKKKITSNPLSTLGYVDAEEFFNGQRVALLVCHHAHIVQTIEIGQSLSITHQSHMVARSDAGVPVCSPVCMSCIRKASQCHDAASRYVGQHV